MLVYVDNSISLAILCADCGALVKITKIAVLATYSSSSARSSAFFTTYLRPPLYTLILPYHTTPPSTLMPRPALSPIVVCLTAPECADSKPHQHRKAALISKAWLEPQTATLHANFRANLVAIVIDSRTQHLALVGPGIMASSQALIFRYRWLVLLHMRINDA